MDLLPVPQNNMLYAKGTPEEQFWRDGAGWPIKPPRYLFLGEAVQRVGEALHPNTWNPLDPVIRREKPLSLALTTSTPNEDLQRAGQLLFRNDEAYRNRCGSPLLTIGYAMPSDEEWQRALAIAQREDEQYRDAFKRFYDVCVFLHEHFMHGKIATFTCPKRGGEMTKQEPHFWNVERHFPRFASCRVSVTQPHRPGFQEDGGDWIFVHENDFEAALDRLERGERLEEESEYLSEYLHFMIRLTRRLELSPANQPLKQDLMQIIREEWQGEEVLGVREVQVMATLLREPKSKKGKAKKSK